MNFRLATFLGIAFYQGVSYASQPGDSSDEYDTGGSFDSTDEPEQSEESDLEELEQWPSAKIPKFNDNLVEHLPSLVEHTCSYGVEGGFLRRLREDEGTWMGHVLEHIAIELQQLAGAKVTFGKTRGTGEEGVYHVVYSYEEEKVGMAAAELGLQLIQKLLPDNLRSEHITLPKDFDFKEELDELIGFAQRRQFGPSTASLVEAAEKDTSQ